ncbi:Synaptotagmin-11 [Madurella mycetomatis]|uniref:Synaptotagmin-11 n=1 Tax=Madurella mycetomatis TaxID=100816 RepID=A0A175VQS6_9PEZI|nr:Synaptotagmin-11 [Madurella mycetomatis]
MADARPSPSAAPSPNGFACAKSPEHSPGLQRAESAEGPKTRETGNGSAKIIRAAATSDLHEKLHEQKGKFAGKKEQLKTKSKPPGGFDPTPLPDVPQGYTVKFTFHRASNLPVGDLHLKSSDPFLHAILTTTIPKRHREDPLLTHRTRTVRKTTEPVWEDDWIVANVPASGFTLKCRLYDEDWPDRDDRLGNVTIRVPYVDENWEGLGPEGRVFEVRKRSGSKRAYVVRGAASVLCGNGPITPQLHVSIKVLGKSDPPHGQMYTVGPATWVKHYSPMIGRLTGVKVNRGEQDGAEPSTRQGDRQTRKYDFQANEIQLSGPVPSRLYHRYVEFRPMVGRMFSSQGVRGRILNKVLHKQHNRIYNFDSSTEYGSFAPCSEEASLQLLRMAHFDEGGRIFTYVITLDGLMRFTETGKEFGIDLLSKHTMHADIATYVACAGEFLIRPLAHPAHHRRHHHHPDNGPEPGSESEAAGEEDIDGSSRTRRDKSDPNPDPDPDPEPNQNEEDNSRKDNKSHDDDDNDDQNNLNQPTHPPDPSLPGGGPPSAPPPPDPHLYQLIIDNDSGTYRPDASVLPDLRRFLQHNFPGLDVQTLHCADDQLKEIKRAQQEAKERESGGQVVRMVLNRSPSGSSLSSDDNSRLGEMERGGGEGTGPGLRSKKERAFEVLWEPGRWREVLGMPKGRKKEDGGG